MKTGGKILIAGLAVAAASAAAYTIHYHQDNSATMTLLLRCDEGLTGTLTLVNSETSVEQTADVAQACKTGSMEIGDYKRGAEIKVTYRPDGQGPATLRLAHGTDIETSPDGFFSVMAIRKAPPHLVRGKL